MIRSKSAWAALLAALMFLGSVSLHAQMTAPSGVWSVTDFSVRTYWWGLVPTGGDFSVLFNGIRFFPGLDTIIENDMGGGYEYDNFYRNSDGSPYWGPSGVGSPAVFDRLEILEGLGIRQGILWDTSRNRNLLEGFLFYRLHYDRNFPATGAAQLVFESSLPDRNQILSNSVIAGLSASTLENHKVHKTWDGLYGEASVEWGPAFLFNGIGSADFFRLNATFKGFRTLYVAPSKGDTKTDIKTEAKADAKADANIFSLYAGDFISVDYAGGRSIPFYVQESTGGLNPRSTTDDWVRGFETGSYDATFKVVNNFDIRAQGPAIIWPSVVPGLYVFTDAGYYSGFDRDPTNTSGGFLASMGAGAYLDFFDLANLTGWIAFPVHGRRVDGAPYSINFDFNLDF